MPRVPVVLGRLKKIKLWVDRTGEVGRGHPTGALNCTPWYAHNVEEMNQSCRGFFRFIFTSLTFLLALFKTVPMGTYGYFNQ